LLIANSRSTFDSAAHIYGGETTDLTLPPAIPADSLVYFGPDLVFARLTLYGIFSECFIPPQLTHRNTTRHQWVFASVIEDSLLLRNMERLSVMSLRASDRRQELDSNTTLAIVE
jgi:hypothetical protein